MAGEENRSLERLAKAALTQLDMLESGQQASPPADAARLSQSALSLLFNAFNAEMGMLERTASVPEGSRKVYGELRARLSAYQKGSVQVREHLLELAKDWECPKCHSDVPAGAALVDPGTGKFELICKQCGTRSAPSAKGEEAFKKWFGHLVGPLWNAPANGFQ